jgi:long-chain acyl-CoA synthetase
MTRTISGEPLATEPEPHLLAALWRWADEQPDRPLLSRRTGDRFTAWSAASVRAEVVGLAAGLLARGVAAGDRVVLLSQTRPEWVLLDHAILAAGAVTVPIYDTASVDQMRAILASSGARLALVETPTHRERLTEAAGSAPVPLEVLTIDEGAVEDLRSVDARHLDAVEARVAALGPEDLAAILYSSGTTGEPKGCELTHGNLCANVRQTVQQVPELFGPDARTLVFLPLAHALGRIQVHVALDQGVEVAVATGLDRLSEELVLSRPTFLVAVPRLFEKVLAGARERAREGGKVRIFDRAMTVAEEVSIRRRAGRRLPVLLRVQHAVLDRLVLQRLRDALGGRVQLAICGGAPLPREVGHRFDGIGIPILEGFGTTETAPIVTGGPAEPLQIGTVGRPYPATTIQLADDGEILVRGPQVFRGYRGDPEATGRALKDGWYHTGDLGAFTPAGHLRIIGRKKDILVTAGGKNVVPAPLEDHIRAHPLVEECVVVGDGRPFVTALVWVDPARMDPGQGPEGQARLREELDAVVAAVNRTVSRAESIGRYAIVMEPLSLEDGSLTPTAKVRRAVVVERYAGSIDQLYRSS